MALTTVHLEADIPDDELQEFLQFIRTWERAHDHVQMSIKVLAQQMKTRDAEEIFRQMEPQFPFSHVYPLRKKP